MAYFKTKIPNLGKFWRDLQWTMLAHTLSIWSTYFTAVCYIFRPFGRFCGYLVCIFPVLVCCTKKNPAALLQCININPKKSFSAFSRFDPDERDCYDDPESIRWISVSAGNIFGQLQFFWRINSSQIHTTSSILSFDNSTAILKGNKNHGRIRTLDLLLWRRKRWPLCHAGIIFVTNFWTIFHSNPNHSNY
jgi:hypothetical protein